MNKKSEQFINDIISRGGSILQDKNEGSTGLMARTVILKLNNCQFKVAYIDLGANEIIVQKTCYCQNNNDCSNSFKWGNIPDNCIIFKEKAS
jgi:hypothetical protein